MAEPVPIRSHPVRLEARLEAARQQRFVGRSTQLDLFREAIAAPEPLFALLFVHGPGGVGKTTLLDALARLAVSQSRQVVRLDGRAIEPAPASFLRALQGEFGLPDHRAPQALFDAGKPTVILLDTYEQLAPLDGWLRDTFLPGLPTHVLTVIAGRNPPAAAWRTDPGWNALLRVLPLRNFDSEESETYLQRRAVPPGQHAAAIKFSHGHPLALSLIADLLIQGDTDALARGLDDPDLIRVLLDRFVQGVPDQLHRRALQLCAHIRVTTEALLAEVISPKRAGELFQWLRDLSFIEQGPSGLFPHDLARDVLEGDLRWRNPEAYREDHRRIRNAIVRTLQSTHGPAQQRAFFDLLFLHRHNPLIKPYVEWAALGTIYAEPAGPVDHPAIVELVRHHEGDASAGIAGFWLERQPQAFTVFRGEGDSVTGFIASLVLAEITPEICAADPAMPAAQTYVERYGPLRSGEVMLHHRFAMGRDAYQNASPVWNMVIMTSNLQWFSTLRLAWSLLLVADPDYWRPTLSYINLRRADEADFTVGDRRYSVFAHDWRAEPPIAWLDLMAERELNTTLTLRDVEAPSPPPVIVLSEPQFRQAVRQALRDFSRPDRLARNPLVQAALVRERPDGSDGVPALRAVLREAAATLTQNPKDRRLYRAIERGCFAPASTQELAAEALGLPFSTYRSHLTTAIQRITDWLWERELDIANHSGT